MMSFKNILKKLFYKFRSQHVYKVENDVLFKYLLYEISDLRKKMRFVIANDPNYFKLMEQTRDSFNYQWGNLLDGKYLLSNPYFVADLESTIQKYTGLPVQWFSEKSVLDAGCGNGRFSYGLASMGSNVTALDQSDNGISSVVQIAEQNNLSIRYFQRNLLDPLNLGQNYDLVWSYGVLHHTGNTLRAFQNIIPYVKKNGYLFLMLYGEPRFEYPQDIIELYHYERLRRGTLNRNFEDKIEILKNDRIVDDVHGWFDAISPQINDLYTFEEIEGWLLSAGFCEIKQTFNNRNIHVIAKKI